MAVRTHPRPGTPSLVVWRLDRLGRSVSDLIALTRQFQEQGVELRSIAEICRLVGISKPMLKKAEGFRKPRRPKGARFYVAGVSLGGITRVPGWEFVNKDEVCRASGKILLSPPSLSHRGFDYVPVQPRFHVSPRLGRRPRDVEGCPAGYWVISDRAKQVLEGVAPADFAFLPIDTTVDAGAEPVSLWLCDVLPILDAIDEEHSTVEAGVADNGAKVHKFVGGHLVFHEGVVAGHQVFRLATSPYTVVCTEEFRARVKAHGLRGLSFGDTYEPSFETVGTVKAFTPSRPPERGWGWGLIAPHGGGKDIFFHQRNLAGASVPAVGQTVHVSGRHGGNGPRAVAVSEV